MRYFQEVIRILDRFRQRRTETVDRHFRERKESKELQLYDGIRDGNFHDDREAAAAIYEASATEAKYTTLKNRLKARLLNSLFHLNLRRAGFSEAAQAFYSCNRQAFMVHVLFALGARHIARTMAKRTLEMAKRFSLSEIALSMARELRASAANTGRSTEYDQYNESVKEIQTLYNAELLSAEYYERVLMVFNRQAGGRKAFEKEFLHYEATLRKMLSPQSTYMFKLNYYRILVRAMSASGKHSAVIAGAKDGLEFLQSAPHLLQRERLGDFYFYQLQSYLGVRNFEAAAEAARHCATYYNPGSNSWFGYMEAQFILLMNERRFREAHQLFAEVTNHTRFPVQSEIFHEHWEIFKFYLDYALRREPDYETREIRKLFNMESLMRTVPVARRDKHGLNVAVLIGQVLQMLEIRDYNGVMDRMEALGTYRARYLQASMTRASSLFFKLLRIMENNSFNYKLARDKGRRYYHQLQTETFDVVDLEQEMQILPYEWLWERVLERLQEQATDGIAKLKK